MVWVALIGVAISVGAWGDIKDDRASALFAVEGFAARIDHVFSRLFESVHDSIALATLVDSARPCLAV